MGPFATGIAAIAAVIVSAGAAYAVYGKQIEEGLKDLRDKGMQIPGIVADFARSLGDNIIAGIKTIPNMVNTVITEAFKAIGDQISSAVRGLIPGAGDGMLPRPQGHPGEDGSPVQHGSLVPPVKQVPVNFTANINLDGRRMAQSTAGYMVASATYPTSAAGRGQSRHLDGAELESNRTSLSHAKYLGRVP
jgi:hypothetical protein